MQPGEVIVAVAFAGVAIGALIFLGSSFQRWIAYKQRKVEVEAEANRAKISDRSDYTEMLEDRIRVLERIATDRGQDIAHQIEALRDRQLEEKL
jgi:hypothetical protein